jgi:outer membrane protein TolC
MTQQTVLDAGRIRENIAVQTALQNQTALAYEASVLTALEDVENALVAYAEEGARRQALVDATEAARRAVALADERYRCGLTDILVVLDTQRSLLSLEDQLTVSTGTVSSNLVRLYKAAGGGWAPAGTP